MMNRLDDSSVSTFYNNGIEDDTCLVNAVRRGDKHAFKSIFENYYNPLLRFAYRYVHSEAVAEGVVQDIFLWIWENRNTWTVEGKLKTYLFRAVKHRAIDKWRQKSTEDKYIEQYTVFLSSPRTEQKSIEESEDQEFFQAAQKAIEALPKKSRIVYKLNRLEGLTYQEISEILEVSPKTVESHMSRALKILRNRLSGWMPILAMLSFIGNLFVKT